MSAQEWTQEKPTTPGWYWLCRGRYRTICEVWERFSNRGRELVVCADGKKQPLDCLEETESGYWLGPLPVPAPPEVKP